MDETYFDKTPCRLGTNSFKWDCRQLYFGDKDVFPLHIADMDFLSAPSIVAAIKERVEKDIFGYSVNSSEHFVYLVNWLKKRHGWNVNPQWCLHSPSAVCSIGMIINALTEEGDGIIVQTPSYPPFLQTVLSFKRKLLINQLIDKDSCYTIDFDDFEQKCKEGAKLFIFCSPHNPTGRVWKSEELQKLAQLCLKYNLLVISDELHADLVYKNNKHIPTSSISNDISDKTFTLCSPSKTFNIAGLATSSIIIPNKIYREKIAAELEKFHLYIPNSIGTVAFDAAYSHGEKWYEEMMKYISSNKKLIEDFFATYLPHIPLSKPEATYLMWINFKCINKCDKEMKHLFHKELKFGLEPGARYGLGGEGYMRLNFALQKEKLQDILLNLKSIFGKSKPSSPA